jgi:hypothetical protein
MMVNSQKISCSTEYVSWSIHLILERLNTKQIDLDPDYQRAPVWTVKRQAGLINSIIQGYPIPSLMLVEKYVDNKKIYACLDGKQRCTAIQAFINDKVTVDINGKQYKYSNLNEEDKLLFKNKILSVAVIEGIPQEEECKIFERINRAAPLSAGELVDTYLTSPIVKARDELFVRDGLFRNYLEKHFGKIKDDDKRKMMLVNLTAITCGLSVGEEYITTSFPTLQRALDDVDENKWYTYKIKLQKNSATLLELWKHIIEIEKVILPEKWLKHNRIWKLAFLLGYQIYSICKIGNEEFQGKKLMKTDIINIWTKFLKVAAKDTTVYDRWQNCLQCKNNNLDTRRFRKAWSKLQEYYIDDKIEVFDIKNNNYDTRDEE